MPALFPAQLAGLRELFASEDWRSRLAAYVEEMGNRPFKQRVSVADALEELGKSEVGERRERYLLGWFLFNFAMGRKADAEGVLREQPVALLIAARKCYEARQALGVRFDAEMANLWRELVPRAVAHARAIMQGECDRSHTASALAREIGDLVRLVREPWLPEDLRESVPACELGEWAKWSIERNEPIYAAAREQRWPEVAAIISKVLARANEEDVSIITRWSSMLQERARKDGALPPDVTLPLIDWLLRHRANPTRKNTFKDNAAWIDATRTHLWIRSSRWQDYRACARRAYDAAKAWMAEPGALVSDFDLSQAGDIAQIWASQCPVQERETVLRDAISWLQRSAASGELDAIAFSAPRIIRSCSLLKEPAIAGAWVERWRSALPDPIANDRERKKHFEFHKAEAQFGLVRARLAGTAEERAEAVERSRVCCVTAARIWAENENPRERRVREPQNHSLHRVLANAAFLAGEFEHSIQQLSWFLEAVPRDIGRDSSAVPIALRWRAKLLNRINRSIEAARAFAAAYHHREADQPLILVNALTSARDEEAASIVLKMCQRHQQTGWPTEMVVAVRVLAWQHLATAPGLFLDPGDPPTPWYLHLLRRALPYDRPPPRAFLESVGALLRVDDVEFRDALAQVGERAAALHYRRGEPALYRAALDLMAAALPKAGKMSWHLCTAMTESGFTLAIHDHFERASRAYRGALVDGRTWDERRQALAPLLSAREALGRPKGFEDRARIEWWPRVERWAAKIAETWQLRPRPGDTFLCGKGPSFDVSFQGWIGIKQALDALHETVEPLAVPGNARTRSIGVEIGFSGGAITARVTIVPLATTEEWDWRSFRAALEAAGWRKKSERVDRTEGVAVLECSLVPASAPYLQRRWPALHEACRANLEWRFDRLANEKTPPPPGPEIPGGTAAEWREFLARRYDQQFAEVEFALATAPTLRRALHRIKNLPDDQPADFQQAIREVRRHLWAVVLRTLPATSGDVVLAFREAQAGFASAAPEIEWRGWDGLPDSIQVAMPQHALDDLMGELLVNAVKHLPKDAPRWIECECARVGVSDSPDDDDPADEDAFEQVAVRLVNPRVNGDMAVAGSTRHGLDDCRAMVERYGGVWHPVRTADGADGAPGTFAVSFDLPRRATGEKNET